MVDDPTQAQASSSIVHVIPFLTAGGAELQLCSLSENQAAAGDAPAIVCISISEALHVRLRRRGVRVIALRGTGARAVLDAMQVLRTAKVVHAWMYHGFLMAVFIRPFARNAHVWSVRRTDPASGGLSRRTRLVVRVTAVLARWCADEIIYCSTASMRAHQVYGYPKKRGVVVYNSIDTVPYPQSNSARLGEPITKVGLLGRWNHDKGIDVLVQAWGLLDAPDVSLILTGPGLDPANAALTAMISTVGARVELAGPTDDPATFIRSLDCLVSASRTEGFPNAVAEAMASAVPVIATDAGGTAEVLGACGELVPPEDAHSLAAAIRRFLESPDELRARATHGPERAREMFSAERCLAATSDAYVAARTRR